MNVAQVVLFSYNLFSCLIFLFILELCIFPNDKSYFDVSMNFLLLSTITNQATRNVHWCKVCMYLVSPSHNHAGDQDEEVAKAHRNYRGGKKSISSIATTQQLSLSLPATRNTSGEQSAPQPSVDRNAAKVSEGGGTGLYPNCGSVVAFDTGSICHCTLDAPLAWGAREEKYRMSERYRSSI